MKSALMALSALLLCGCASVPFGRYDLADDIAEDHAALNDAYGRAVNGEILLNVMRSRDRWPRHYTNVKEIYDQPTITTGGTLTISPLGFNNPSDPYRSSNLALRREEQVRPNYGVQPLDSAAITRAVLSPTSRGTFAHYWSTSWPRDVLLLVMGASITRAEGAALSESELLELAESGTRSASGRSWGNVYHNSGEALATRCPAENHSEGCEFYRLAMTLDGFDVELRPAPDARCRRSAGVALEREQAALLQGMASAAAEGDLTLELSSGRDSHAEVMLVSCDSRNQSVVLQRRSGSTIETYHVELRSLDSMVYAMGEIIRTADGNVPIVRPPDCPNPCSRRTALFRVIPGPVDEDGAYAAVVNHVDQRYFAGQVVRNGGENEGDRTATVLTLLTQLFAVNNSPNAITPLPGRPVVD